MGTDRERERWRERKRERDRVKPLYVHSQGSRAKLTVLVVPFNDIPFGGLFSTNAVLRSYWLLVKL